MAEYNTQTGEWRDPVSKEPVTNMTVAKPEPRARAEKTPVRSDLMKSTYEFLIANMAKDGIRNPDSATFNRYADATADKFPNVAEFVGEMKRFHQQQLGKQQPQSIEADRIKAQTAGRNGTPQPRRRRR